MNRISSSYATRKGDLKQFLKGFTIEKISLMTNDEYEAENGLDTLKCQYLRNRIK